jgi:hypothetical protein
MCVFAQAALCSEYKTMVFKIYRMSCMSVDRKICEVDRELVRTKLELQGIVGRLDAELESVESVGDFDTFLREKNIRLNGNEILIDREQYIIPLLADGESVTAFLRTLFINLATPWQHFEDMLFVIVDAVQSSNSNYVTSVDTFVFSNRQTSLRAVLSMLIVDAVESSQADMHYLSNASFKAAWFNAGNEHTVFTLRDVGPNGRLSSFTMNIVDGERTTSVVYLQSSMHDGAIQHHVAFPSPANADMTFSNRFYSGYSVDNRAVIARELSAAIEMAHERPENVLFCFQCIFDIRRAIMQRAAGPLDELIVNLDGAFTTHAKGHFESQVWNLLHAVYPFDDIYPALKLQHTYRFTRRVCGTNDDVGYSVSRLADGAVQIRVPVPWATRPVGGPSGVRSEGEEATGPRF